VKNACANAEALAGAIALGEASESERERYRRHLAGCPACCERLGGERELERAAETIALARENERWEPVLTFSRLRERRASRLRSRLATSAMALAVVFAIAFALHPVQRAHDVRPLVTRVAEVAPVHRAEKAPVVRHIVVVHNVVTLSAPAPVVPVPHHTAQPQPVQLPRVKSPEHVAQVREPKISVPASNVPIWRRNAPLPIDTPGPRLVGHAESIAVAPVYVIREVMPVGGENAIEPKPPMIAYAERAQGTTAFDVSVNARGMATKCTITKSSGYLSLDDAVCRAAMGVRYFPKTINGKAVASTYRDAFTFRQSDTEPEFP
jgi:TonB family protein